MRVDSAAPRSPSPVPRASSPDALAEPPETAAPARAASETPSASPTASAAADARGRSKGIDGLRGFAALTVFVFHVWLYGRLGSEATGDIGTLGLLAFQFRIGLICFFVLTGFLLYRSFARAARLQRGPVDWKRYATRRLARILPAYYVSLAGAFLLLRIAAVGSPGVRLPEDQDLWKYVLLVQNYFSDSIMRVNPVTWTLVLEIGFYALVPLIGLFAYYVGRGRRWPQVLFAVAMIVGGVAWHQHVYVNDLSQLYSKALPHYLPYFAFGILAALYVDWRDERRPGPLRPAATLVVFAIGAGLVVANGWWHAHAGSQRTDQAVALLHDMPAGAGFGFLIVAAAIGAGPSIAWIRAWPLASLGVVSYGFYLWHVPLILFGQSIGIETSGFVPMFLIFFPVTLLFAMGSWFLVEKPLIARVHRAPRRAEAERKRRSSDPPPPGGDGGLRPAQAPAG